MSRYKLNLPCSVEELVKHAEELTEKAKLKAARAHQLAQYNPKTTEPPTEEDYDIFRNKDLNTWGTAKKERRKNARIRKKCRERKI